MKWISVKDQKDPDKKCPCEVLLKASSEDKNVPYFIVRYCATFDPTVGWIILGAQNNSEVIYWIEIPEEPLEALEEQVKEILKKWPDPT